MNKPFIAPAVCLGAGFATVFVWGVHVYTAPLEEEPGVAFINASSSASTVEFADTIIDDRSYIVIEPQGLLGSSGIVFRSI